MTKARLILIKHALPQIDPDVPSALWVLGEEGRAAAAEMGRRLAGLGARAVISSTEPKAVETGQIIARELGLPCSADEDFGETKRETVGFLPREAFDAGICKFFAEPLDLVFGEETADQAYERFSGAIERHEAAGEGPLIIAAHGTVISLFLSRRTGADAMELWRSLKLPHALVLGFDLQLIDSVTTV